MIYVLTHFSPDFCFISEKEGKAIHLSYQDKLLLVAYVKQITNGKYDPSNSPPVGYLDVVGNDRR